LVKEKLALPLILMAVLALTRWPGLLPANFSAVYGLLFCAGVYFPKRLAWWLPLATILLTDLLINWHYGAALINGYTLVNYAVYLVILWLGRRFSPKASFMSLLGGGLLGAILFYFITNTASWLQNPEYAKTLAGWLQALTIGTAGWPHTWEFFRNPLLSGGMFTGLFVGAMKLAAAAEPQKEEETEPAAADEAEPEPEESKA
jgi:hypothetical protein